MESPVAKKLLDLLLQPPSEGLRNEIFALVVEMSDAGLTQTEAAKVLAFAQAVWSQKKLGNQSARLEPLGEAAQIVSGFEDAPSPVYGTILGEAIKITPDPSFVAASKKAVNAVAQYHDTRILSLEEKQAAMQRELDLLLAEDSGEDEEDIDDGVAADDEDDEEKEKQKKARHEQRLREEAEKEFAALEAEEKLFNETKR
eukprot:gnl/MRDRNA2_/MRDRNA2_122426_c0_seq1.p1 gnl/MRDRNA2_/MRDRNA2_122426_c0~~gnl/MRDRNA2_/MRDRNA2_122426_c0_seq1.p1  ORF type:complete len:200 (-),score=72.69 gnl/MRDRNA2_/MRDRNA2_122426_c0_seq1:44-643(-)